MFVSHPKRRRVLAIVFMILAFVAATLPATTQAQATAPRWQNWGLRVTFEDDALQVIYTVYVGSNEPEPHVISSTEEDITGDCTVQGTLDFSTPGDSAGFNGSTYIECSLPSWRDALHTLDPTLPGANRNIIKCDCGAGPLWADANLILDPVSGTNPLFYGDDIGFSFSVPTNGIQARSRLDLSSGSYPSQNWMINPQGNRVVSGMHGEAIVAVANHFQWLDYLIDARWQDFFKNYVTGMQIGHWRESPTGTTLTSAADYRLKTTASTVYIGHNPSTGAHFRGVLTVLNVDPGCQGA